MSNRVAIEANRKSRLQVNQTIRQVGTGAPTVNSTLTLEDDSIVRLTQTLDQTFEKLPPQPRRTAGRLVEAGPADRRARPAKTRASSLDHLALDTLLSLLDPDRERASEEYLLLRLKLTKFFEYRRCNSAAELTDETIDRVVSRLKAGEEITSPQPVRYFYGVARNVLLEYQHRCLKLVPLEELDPNDAPRIDPSQMQLLKELKLSQEQHMECLQLALARMAAETREMLVDYYEGRGDSRIRKRQDLAARMGITVNALKIRIYRMRIGLSKQVSRMLIQPSN